MDRGRRHRRGRGHSRTCHNLPHTVTPPQPSKAWAFISSLSSFFIMTSLIALIYLMLEFHCNNCKDKCNINNFSKSIDNIAKNLSIIKDSYYDLEIKISRFSQDLPKLEGQIDVLEALAHTIKRSRLAGWDPKMQMPLPNVEVYLNKPQNFSKVNTSEVCSTCAIPLFKPVEVKQCRQDDSKDIKELRNQCVGYF